MVVNFKAHRISWGTHKLTQTSTLIIIIIIKKAIECYIGELTKEKKEGGIITSLSPMRTVKNRQTGRKNTRLTTGNWGGEDPQPYIPWSIHLPWRTKDKNGRQRPSSSSCFSSLLINERYTAIYLGLHHFTTQISKPFEIFNKAHLLHHCPPVLQYTLPFLPLPQSRPKKGGK